MRVPDPARGAVPVLMLAAGRGRRLAGSVGEIPKILLEFGGRSLLDRHLERLERAGAGALSLVVGYQSHLIEVALERLDRSDQVTLIHNPDWREGSIVSLDAGRAVLEHGGPVVLMDADVIYAQAVIDRLMASRHPGALLLDRELEPGDEPVKICLDAAGRIVDFAKRPDAAHAWHGESVGFFRFSAEIAAGLALRARALIEAGGLDLEYEEPIRALIRADTSGSFGYEEVSGLPWTEIDFMEDVARAQSLAPSLSELVA